MKRCKIIWISLIVMLMAGVAIYFEACKKEIVTPINNMQALNDYPDYTPEAKLVAGKIRRFKKQLVEKESVARSGLNMPIDSVIWNVEALFNAEHAFPERKFLKTVKQELEFSVALNGNNEAHFEEVADLYDDITDAVRYAYLNDGVNVDKALKAVVVERGEIVGNTQKIKAYVISGEARNDNSVKDPLTGPFGPADCWYFGEYGGTCDDPSVFGDAAEIIEDTINYYYGGNSVPQSGFRCVNHAMFRISLEGNEYFDSNGEPYLYYYGVNDNPPLYLDYEMLNYYYTRELQVLLHLLPNDLINQGVLPHLPAFIEVDIVGQLGYVANTSCYHHSNYVVYGSKAIIPSQELPPVRDLLN